MRRAEIERLLPAIFQRTARPEGPLVALLEVMEAMHAPAEAALEGFDAKLDPRRAPEPFVWYLAQWVDLNRLYEQRSGGDIRSQSASLGATVEVGRLRELIAMAAHLSKWRGTARGLLLFLETATGIRGFTVDEEVADPSGRPRPFHLRVLAPTAAASQRALIERIIELEKPAYVTSELIVHSELGRGGEVA